MDMQCKFSGSGSLLLITDQMAGSRVCVMGLGNRLIAQSQSPTVSLYVNTSGEPVKAIAILIER